MVKAVIDVGSNSVLLLVAEKRGEDWNPLFETTAVTALGEGTRTTGKLSERGINDTLAALEQAYAHAKGQGAEEIIAAITMAGRLAANTGDFLRQAREQGTPVAVLSAEDEAELGFRAVAEDPLFANLNRVSVIDVGGHSTELVTGVAHNGGWNLESRDSFAIGTLGLRETVMADEAAGHGAVVRASRMIDDAIGLNYLPGRAGEAVSLGATGVNLASIRAGMEWDATRWHGAELEFEEVSRATGWLCAMTDEQRAAVPGIEPGRERTLHLGALILERFMHALMVDRCLVSARGWRYALLSHPAKSLEALSR